MRPVLASLAVAILALLGCSTQSVPVPAPVASSPPAPPQIEGLPLRLTVTQRSTTNVPGSQDGLSLTIDDITRGQVMVSLLHDDSGEGRTGPMSMREGDSSSFSYHGRPYALRLVKLENLLLGEDRATFEIADPTQPQLTEDEKIERLIRAVETLTDAVFIRNGEEHSAVEAAAHLRRKRTAAGASLKTATEFIEAVASRSAVTGEVYQIRMPNGKLVESRTFLQQELQQLP